MRTVIFGGSFNPPHLGHLEAAQSAAQYGGKVLFIPNFQSPLKADKPASPKLRTRMLDALLENQKWARISYLEILQNKPCFTEDTIHTLQDQLTDPHITLLIGSDILSELPQWKNFAGWKNKVGFLICPRQGHPIPDGIIEQLEIRGEILPAPATQTSSTEIRELVKAGKPIVELTGKPIADIIRTHHLYN